MNPGTSIIRTAWRFLRPEIQELASYLIAVAALAGIAIYRSASNGEIGIDSQDIISAIRHTVGNITGYLSSGSGWAHFFLFGFWFLVGAVAYFCTWAVISLLVDLYNDIVISAAFIHPRSFSQSDYWASIVSRWLLRATAGIALFFYGVFWLWVIAPACVDQFRQTLQHAEDPLSYLNAALTIVTIFLTMHIAVILIRIMFLRPSK